MTHLTHKYIYSGNHLKYPLSQSEHDILDAVWSFIDKFRFLTYGLHEYRSKIIDTIRKDYTPEKFYELERIAEKLFWNLRYNTYDMFLSDRQKGIEDLLNLKEGSY